MARIYLHDELNPEATAMLQALYSRSSESVELHVAKVRERGSSKFMESYYVGYGHASIGDCGTTTLFIEGVSIIACKAIQDHPLYSGQESSTRYIDFSKQVIFDPIRSDVSRQILDRWMSFYHGSQETLTAHLRSIYPLLPGQSERIWEKAIQARCFDILRGFLPAGTTTQLSWSTNLRQAYDKLELLRHHPLNEVRQVAGQCLSILKDKYPSSFGHKLYKDKEEYLARTSLKTNYLTSEETCSNSFEYSCNIDNELLEKFELDVITNRPPKTNLPRYLGKYGTYNCKFIIDYGSFRDLQRHRNGICHMPVVDGRHGFHTWYFDQLPPSFRREASTLVEQQFEAISHLAAVTQSTPVEMQYFYPLGTSVMCQVVYDLPQMVYVTELRSGVTVHPTLRKVTHKMHEALTTEHPTLQLHTDLREDEWDIRRGLQDIVKREEIG